MRSSRLRICLLVTYDLAPRGGGVKQHALHLAAALRKQGDEVTILGPSSSPNLDIPGAVGMRGVVNVPSNGSDNFLGIFCSPYLTRRFFREHSFDVIHVHEPLSPSLSYWATWFVRDVPHVATFHAFAENESAFRNASRRVWGATLEPWFQRAIAVSEPAARYAAVAWKRPITVIPNGVPTELFRPATSVKVNDDGPVKLLFVGRLGDTRKGVRYLFDAYARLKAKGVDVTLDVVGELGNAEAPPQLPGLTYHGELSLERLIEQYQACDALVAPSTGQESFGIILLEAMSSAKPVICSDIEGYRQVATTLGSRRVPPRDAPALAGAIADFAKLAPAKRRHMGEANLAHARQYDWAVIARRVRQEYLAALGVAVDPGERLDEVEPASVDAPESASPTGTQ